MMQKISVHRIDIARHLEPWNRLRVPAVVREEVLRFVDDLGLGKVNRGKRISEARQCVYLDRLRIPLAFLNKPTGKITTGDIERFEKALTTNRIRSEQRGRPYSDATKADLRKALRVFLRWRLGSAKAVELAGWLDTRVPWKTPRFMNEGEIERLLKRCRTVEQRYVIAMLFDSGARAEEFINIRLEDIQLPTAGDTFVKVTLKQEYSKTLGRTVSLYWRHTLEAARDYVAERVASGLRPQDPIYAKTYNGLRMFLRRLGGRVFGRSIYPHLFRHSSATYYAPKLNRQQLCYRYGWRFSSNMPDVYISRSGMENQQLDEKFTQTELSTLKDDLSRVTQDNQIKAQRIEELQDSVEAMRQNVEMITEVLARNPSIRDVERALIRKRRLAAGEV